jgi:hypothetical protein
MRKITTLLLMSLGLLNASCQNNSFLSYFPDIEGDTIINTMREQDVYYKMAQKNNFPDSVSLRHFFDNDKDKMYGTEEGYNLDDDTYFTTSYIKKVCPLFKKRNEDLYLLCYGIESVLYLAIYNPEIDKILNSFKVSDFSDDMGNVVTHSTIFPNNYIVTTQINDRTYYKLFKIDYNTLEFKELKSVEAEDNKAEQNKKIKEAFSVLGITENGELIE